jgi:hypothetical protein
MMRAERRQSEGGIGLWTTLWWLLAVLCLLIGWTDARLSLAEHAQGEGDLVLARAHLDRAGPLSAVDPAFYSMSAAVSRGEATAPPAVAQHARSREAAATSLEEARLAYLRAIELRPRWPRDWAGLASLQMAEFRSPVAGASLEGRATAGQTSARPADRHGRWLRKALRDLRQSRHSGSSPTSL